MIYLAVTNNVGHTEQRRLCPSGVMSNKENTYIFYSSYVAAAFTLYSGYSTGHTTGTIETFDTRFWCKVANSSELMMFCVQFVRDF